MTRRATAPRLGCCALVAALLAGCGGSSHVHTTSSATTPTSTRAPATTTRISTSAGTKTKTSSPPPETTTTGAAGVHLPATFTIQSGGTLAPPSVSAPAGVPVELTVVSGDGKAHQVVLKAPARRTLSVPAGGRAQAVLTGLAKGQYPLQVDGAMKGTVIIGGQPGP